MISGKRIFRVLFWDPVRPGENSAQTVVRVLGNLTRTAITLAIIVSVGSTLYLLTQNHNAGLANNEDAAVRAFSNEGVEIRERMNALEELRELNRRGELDSAYRDRLEALDQRVENIRVEFSSTDECPENQPIQIVIYNQNDYAITNVVVSVSARRTGRSTDLADIVAELDFIVPASGSKGTCSRPVLAETDVDHQTLIWSADTLAAIRWDGPLE